MSSADKNKDAEEGAKMMEKANNKGWEIMLASIEKELNTVVDEEQVKSLKGSYTMGVMLTLMAGML